MAKRYGNSRPRNSDQRYYNSNGNDGYYNDNDRYYNDNGGIPNHHSQKYNDEKHSDKDFSQDGFFRRRSAAEDYMGMPTSMRSGLEKEQNPMIREDHRAIANLPQEVRIQAYPVTGPYMPEDLDDTGRGVDAQMNYDDAQRRSHFYPKKV